MKKVILLLLVLCCSNVIYSQNKTNQTRLTAGLSTNLKPLEEVYLKFEDAVFTQSDKKEIITSYLKLGKSHRDLGHLKEAASFFKRAFVLADGYYPEEDNPLKQIVNKGRSILDLFILYILSKEKQIEVREDPGNFWSKPNADSIQAIPYLQHAKQLLSVKGSEALTPDGAPISAELQEQKVVASFFMAITEPADYDTYTLRKRTSLRQGATHKSKSFKRLAVGTKLNVLEKTNKYWWKVIVDGTIGYVKALLLKQNL